MPRVERHVAAKDIAANMRAVADWCNRNVHRIPVQVKTRSPGEMASLLDHLADFVESGQPFSEGDLEGGEIERLRAERDANKIAADGFAMEATRLRARVEGLEEIRGWVLLYDDAIREGEDADAVFHDMVKSAHEATP